MPNPNRSPNPKPNRSPNPNSNPNPIPNPNPNPSYAGPSLWQTFAMAALRYGGPVPVFRLHRILVSHTINKTNYQRVTETEEKIQNNMSMSPRSMYF